MKKKFLFIFLLFIFSFCFGDEKKIDSWNIKLDTDKHNLSITDAREKHYLKVTFITGSLVELETIYKALNCEEDCINLNLADMGFDTVVAKSISHDPETGDIISFTSLILSNDLEIDE